MSKVVLVKGSHCFKCVHWSDYMLEEVPGAEDVMRIACAHDRGSQGELYREGQSGPEREICALFESDAKYLEFRRKFYGRE